MLNRFTRRLKFAAMAAVVGILAFSMLPLTGCNGSADNSDDPVVATVNGKNLYASTLTDYIDPIRSQIGSDSDAAWEAYLEDQGYEGVDDYWQKLIQFYGTEMAVSDKCDELGITATDDEIQEQIDSIKATLKATSLSSGDDGYDEDAVWQSYLDACGYESDQDVKDVLSYNIKANKLMEQEVTKEDPSDDVIQAYANQYASSYASKRSSLIATEDYDLAQDLLEKFQKDPDPKAFAKAAKKYSEDSSASDGGDKGWMVLGSFDSSYSSAVEETEKGQVYSGTLLLNDKYYCVILVTDDYEAELGKDDNLDLDAMPDDLYKQLVTDAGDALWSSRCSDYKQHLYDEADVNILVEHQYDIPGQSHGEGTDASVSGSGTAASISGSTSAESGASSTDQSSSSANGKESK